MKIEHIAVWVKDLERMKHFYETYFEAQANALYHNPLKGFSSYFLHFKSGARLEEDGYTRLDGPRLTGDGYYESVFLDPEGLTIELTV